MKKLKSHQVDEMLAILENEDSRRSYEAEAFIASEQADAQGVEAISDPA